MIEVAEEDGIVSSDLHRLITTATLFAGNDDTLPMLKCIRFIADGKNLISVATDRFMVGASRAPMVTAEPFEFLLDREQAKIISDIAKPGRRHWRILDRATLTLTPKGKKLNVSFAVQDITVGVPTKDLDFPKYSQLFKKQDPDNPGLPFIAVNPNYLAKFGKVATLLNDHQMGMTFTKPSRPIQVNIGQDFCGLIMPVRSAESAEVPTWLK